MTTYDGTSAPSPAPEDPADPQIDLPKVRSPERTAGGIRPLSELGRPFRRSNTALSSFFASSAAAAKRASSPAVPFPPRRASRSSSPAGESRTLLDEPNEYRSLILRSFAPHIAVLPSADTEEFLAQKGLPGGLLTLLRPFGENVAGKITIRDSSGSSKTCEDYSVHFRKLKDGLESPRMQEGDAEPTIQNIGNYLDQQNPESAARVRTGGDVEYIEDALQKRLQYSDLLGREQGERRASAGAAAHLDPPNSPQAFYLLYLARLLSGLPAIPHETFSHPVACVIAVSSRSADPIEELRQLNASTRSGDDKLPAWMNNDYLRYFVLLHDEEHDDITRSQSLYEQMKRHFGLHVHMLRLRSTQCVPSDDGCVHLPICEWQSASEELAEITRREQLDELDTDTGPYIFDSDANAVKTLVRELVTQSIIPQMERLATTWNDQIVSKRRGISGRFFSLSRKWASPFSASTTRRFSAFGTGGGGGGGGSGNTTPTEATSTGKDTPPASPGINGNYDAGAGSYAPDTPEALMRKLGDYAFMLRDFKLAHATYDLLRSDYANDKAWAYHAGAHELTALSALLLPVNHAPRARAQDTLDALLETAVVSYMTRASPATHPYAALRALLTGAALLSARACSQPAISAAPAADQAARWAAKALELALLGPAGAALTSSHIASCYGGLPGAGSRAWASRRRKALLWSVSAALAWLRAGNPALAEPALADAQRLAGLGPAGAAALGRREAGHVLSFAGARQALAELRAAVAEAAGSAMADDVAALLDATALTDSPGERDQQGEEGEEAIDEVIEDLPAPGAQANPLRRASSSAADLLRAPAPAALPSRAEPGAARSDAGTFRAATGLGSDMSISIGGGGGGAAAAAAAAATTTTATPIPNAKPDIRRHRRSVSRIAVPTGAEGGREDEVRGRE